MLEVKAGAVLGDIIGAQAIEILRARLHDIPRHGYTLYTIGDPTAVERLITAFHFHSLSASSGRDYDNLTEHVIDALYGILEGNASKVSSSDLTRITEFKDIYYTVSRSLLKGCGGYESTEKISSARIRQIARQELIRRERR